jgi:SAM-dependent methyltransferase
MSGIKPPDEQKQAGGGHAWSGSSEAASKYLGARIPYSQYLIDYIIAYHEHASEKPAKWDAVLDLACGPGQLGIHLSSRFKHIYGRDVSQQMLDIAKALPRLDQEQLRKFSLIKPAPDRTFDYA